MVATAHGGRSLPRWGELRKLAIDAVTADIAALLRTGSGKRLTPKPLEAPAGGSVLAVRVSDPGTYWREQLFFVVDADLREPRSQDRLPVRYHRYEGNQLQLKLPHGTQEALREVHSVYVYRVDELELELKRALKKVLERARPGELVRQLWDAEAPAASALTPRESQAVELNPSQREALAAMTSPGGWFVWGPPGTGKTTVITEVVRHALDNGRSVLIASHTHVAVDNVLEGVAAPESGIDFACGDVVRVASRKTESNISAAVSGHDHLLLSKAAAVLNRTAERLEAVGQRKQANATHAARQERAVLLQALAAVDTGEIKRAQAALAALDEIARLEAEHRTVEDEVAARRERIAEHERAADSLAVLDGELAAADDGVRASKEALAEATRGRDAARQALVTAETQRDAVASRLAATRTSAQTSPARALAPVRALRARRALVLEAEHADATQRVEQSATLLGQATRHAERCDATARAAVAKRTELEEHRARATEELVAARRLSEQVDELAERASDLNTEIRELRPIVSQIPEATARPLLDRATREGSLEKIERLDQLHAEVNELDEELEEINRARDAIDAEEAETRQRILREARVVACTLASYVFQPPDLQDRRFDLVILDEASSIEAPYVALAGSRATSTFAVVGDFLQNAPIADTDGADPDAPEPHPWQATDIFALAGITDHASALRHERCVALRTQYRFPAIIAVTVNAFCYGGILETAAPRPRHDAGAVVTMIDTSAHFAQRLTQDGSSWWSVLGLQLLGAIAHDSELHAGSTFGFITPYRAQAHHARRLQLKTATGITVDCGTAHAFQGRQYDTVVVDLMQDDRPRWVSHANLHGTARAIAAAKLLNVALTRTKRRLYLIGDWNYIQRGHSPGMRALAALQSHPDFTVIDAADLLTRR